MTRVSADPKLNVPKLPKPYVRVLDRAGRRLADTPTGTYNASVVIAEEVENKQAVTYHNKQVSMGVQQDIYAESKLGNSAKADRAKAAREAATAPKPQPKKAKLPKKRKKILGII